MFWSTLNFEKLSYQLLPPALRKNKTVAFFKALMAPLEIIAAATLYKMQHDGRTIYLEKMLNEFYSIPAYDHQNHETTKLIYIDDLPEPERVYIHQNVESETLFLEDDGDDNDDDIFLDGDNENNVSYSWIIFMPDTITFDEYTLRAKVDSFRYSGKKYTIEIFTP